MADTDVETDFDFAFSLQLEEAMTASLIGDEQEIFQNVSYLQTLELLQRLKLEDKDGLQWQTETNQKKDDLKRLIHDQEVAIEMSRIPDDQWEETGGHFEKPFGEGSSSSNDRFLNNEPFKLYFKGLFSNERAGDTIAGIGFAVCDPLVGDWKSDFAPEELELKVEAKALIEGLTAAYSLDIKRIDFYCDYYPLYQYITMRYLVNQQNIATVVDQVSLLQRNFISCRPFLVDRKDVKFAFKLARNAVDSQIAKLGECSNARNKKETCDICLEDISMSQMFSVYNCSHRYCCSCMRKHVEVKLLDGVMPPCPHDGCRTMLNQDNCKQFMTPKLNDMMTKRIKEDSVPVTEKVYCPNPKCSNLMSKNDIPKCVYKESTNEHLCGKCMKCNEYFCFKCKVQWHNGMTCEAYQAQIVSEDDAKLKKLADTKLWRQCKKCNHMIELIWGCYHITCRCGHEFCYTCGAVWINRNATCDCPIWDEGNQLLHLPN
ncbi:hypothetical protein MKW98_007476 [Papaver atlanticum]|uniref:RBR-type E3 ubiquitin transferase n=1 Tax=Papaver atlanticum TaxID=357466 RepID=A0AAD4SCR9_9MAGN|nr:hypothetical protein MKW98_007476 [Papaver atlanticum]